jgi:allantoate deiminase
MMQLRTSCERLKVDIEALAKYTSTPGSGVTRLSFTEEHRLANEYIIKQMADAGLEVFVNSAGTVVGRREGTDPELPVVMMGSHIDTVKHGGAFDGTAGVVAAIEAARVMHRSGFKNRHPIEVVAMTEEEGTRFNDGMLSSEAMAGLITNKALDDLKDDCGITLRKAMQDFGIKPDLDRAKRSDIKAFVELHIEQGPMLEAKGTDIGIVENIAGISVYKVTVVGKSGHAGTTPMHLRSDALLAAAHIITATNDVVNKIGKGSVATVGRIGALPGVSNVISNFVQFSIDIRASKQEYLDEVINAIKAEARIIENKFKVAVSFENPSNGKPVKLSTRIGELIEESAAELGYSYIRMDSGAAHDSMAMAEIADTGMIFVPCKGGISHNSDEWTDYESLQKGAEVLLSVVERLSCLSGA